MAPAHKLHPTSKGVVATNYPGLETTGEGLDDDQWGGMDDEGEEVGSGDSLDTSGWEAEDYSSAMAAIEGQDSTGKRFLEPRPHPSLASQGASLQEDHDEWSPQEQRMLRHLFLMDHLAFTRYFLRKRDSTRFILSPHHRIMAQALERVHTGEISRLIINVPPGYTKTEMAVIHFIARGLALNPRSKFIHISYADNLALLNSSAVKELCTSEEYKAIFPMTLKEDAKSKKAWYNEWGGGMMAVASGGTITGFRAGRMMEGFSGAIIIDDPIKPDDAYSELMRSRVNNRFTNTFKSRLAHEKVAIIVIMQRIHEDDPTGFLLAGGTGEKWHHLNLPVEILPVEEREAYPPEYTHGIPIDYDLPTGPLWEYKHTIEDIVQMRSSDPYTTAAQYDQRPSPLGGGMFKDEWWQFYDVTPPIDWKFITADTASKTKEHNDFSVFQCWGMSGNNLYMLDQIRGKWEAPMLKVLFVSFWQKHFGSGVQTTGRLRFAAVEDKSSGTGLIQDLAAESNIPIQAIQRNQDKVTRSMDMIPYIASKRVHLPAKADFLADYLAEFRKFTPLMSHKHDDQIDPTLDAIDIALRPDANEAGSW